jgi:hypothetical protein
MNYLIKQFAIDCAGQKEWDFPKDPKSYTFTPDELTKFAELIVGECIDYCGENLSKTVGGALKIHFGVEE